MIPRLPCDRPVLLRLTNNNIERWQLPRGQICPNKTGMLRTRKGHLDSLYARTSKVMCFYRNGRQGRVEIGDLLSLSHSLAEGNEKIGPLRFENKIRGAGSVGVNDSFTMNAKNTLGCSLPLQTCQSISICRRKWRRSDGGRERERQERGLKWAFLAVKMTSGPLLRGIPTEYDIFVNGKRC